MIKRDLGLKNDVVVDGKKYMLSTVSLVSVSGSLIWYGDKYETMLFAYHGDNVNYRDLYCQRYETRLEAIKGHTELYARLSKGEKIWTE